MKREEVRRNAQVMYKRGLISEREMEVFMSMPTCSDVSNIKIGQKVARALPYMRSYGLDFIYTTGIYTLVDMEEGILTLDGGDSYFYITDDDGAWYCVDDEKMMRAVDEYLISIDKERQRKMLLKDIKDLDDTADELSMQLDEGFITLGEYDMQMTEIKYDRKHIDSILEGLQ